jgi:hypothetical protein
MYLDASPQHSPPHQVPYKLANQWMGQYVSLDVRCPSVSLDLQLEMGKISPWVNVRRLKFFEQCDADFTDLEGPVSPVRGGDGLMWNEIHQHQVLMNLVPHRSITSTYCGVLDIVT